MRHIQAKPRGFSFFKMRRVPCLFHFILIATIAGIAANKQQLYANEEQIERKIKDNTIWDHFPETIVQIKSNNRYNIIKVYDLGPMQSCSISAKSFILSTLSFIPVNMRHSIRYKMEETFLRDSQRWHALVDPSAINRDMSKIVRISTMLNLAMDAVKIVNGNEFKTDFGAALFTKRWAPPVEDWEVVYTAQYGNKHGVVVYGNRLIKTLAIAFRPYIDPDHIDKVIGAFEADAIKFSTPVDLVASDEFTIQVLPALLQEYELMESGIFEFLDSAISSEFDKLMVGGISAAGIFAQFFAARAAASADLGDRFNRFIKVHFFAFNSPPVFSKPSPVAWLLDKISEHGWEYSRVISDDFCSVYWFGAPQTKKHVENYQHLGPALRFTTDPRILRFPLKKAVTLVNHIEEIYFPIKCFSFTSVSSEKTLNDLSQSKLRWEWKKLRHHVLGIGLTVTLFAEAIMRRLNMNRRQFQRLLW